METRAEVLDRWQKLVNEYKVSGLTRKTFCEQKGIKPHSLYYYKNYLDKNNKDTVFTNTSALIPIELKAKQVKEVFSVKFILRNGTICLLPLELSDERLQKIIQVLGSC